MDLTQYKDILGKPREGAHSIRIPIIDWALVDVLLTILLVYIFYLLGYTHVVLLFIFFFLLGEMLHYIFGVKTAFIKQVSGEN